jgi:hypothetical protein
VPEKNCKRRLLTSSANACQCVRRRPTNAFDSRTSCSSGRATAREVVVALGGIRPGTPGAEGGTGLTREDMIDTVAALFAIRDVPPKSIRDDNGRVHCASHSELAGKSRGPALYIETGSHVGERLRRELPQPLPRRVPGYVRVRNVTIARRLTNLWKDEYLGTRSHSCLGYVHPSVLAAVCYFRSGVDFDCASAFSSTPAPHPRFPFAQLRSDWERN